MKNILALLIPAFAALTVSAQTTTNLAWRVTVETVSGGVTNSVNTNFRWDASVKKETLIIDGLSLAFANYRANGGTNDFGVWIKTDVRDRANEYARVKQQADSAITLAKLTILLTSQSDLLTAGDLANLATIAAKAP